jgi:MOSC domain-containing protein YiiM
LYYGAPNIYSLAPDGTELFSSIRKQKFESGIATKDGFVEDVQFEDIAIHGGPERALLHFDTADYQLLQSKIKQFHKANNVKQDLPKASLYKSPAIGENISTDGTMNAKTVCIGDIYRVGNTLLQVTQPRKPCLKLNHVFEYPMFSVFAEENAACGWFYRVLEEGEIKIGDQFIFVERTYPNVTVFQVQRTIWDETMSEKELEEIIACEPLAGGYKTIAKNYLEKGFPGIGWKRLIGTEKAFLSKDQLKKDGDEVKSGGHNNKYAVIAFLIALVAYFFLF